MTTILRTNAEYIGDLAKLPSPLAPMPADASGWADFVRGQFISAAGRHGDATALFRTSSAIYMRWYSDGADYQLSPANSFLKVEASPSGEVLGLLVEGINDNLVARSQRQALSAGASSGLSVTALEARPEDWQRWSRLTASEVEAPHTLTLTTSGVTANHKRCFAIELRQGTHRYVQLAIDAGPSNYFANFDLVEGRIAFTAGGVSAYMLRTPEGWLCYIVYSVATATADDRPYLALVPEANSPKGAAGDVGAGYVDARLPKVRSGSSASVGYPPLTPWPDTDLDSINADIIAFQTSILPDTGDFTIALRARSSIWPDQNQGTLFKLENSSSNGLAVRVLGNLTMGVVRRVSGNDQLLRDLGDLYVAERLYRLVVSRQGSTIRIVSDAGSWEGSDPAFVTAVPRMFAPFLANQGWNGHLQRAIAWPMAKNMNQMRAMIESGLI